MPPGENTYPPGDTTAYTILQAYTCRSNATTPTRRGRRGHFTGNIWENTQHAPYPWDFTASLHPYICIGWGLLQWLCQFFLYGIIGFFVSPKHCTLYAIYCKVVPPCRETQPIIAGQKHIGFMIFYIHLVL